MTLKYSEAIRNARLAVIESQIGAGATLEVRSGAAPASPAAADTGTVLASLSLPDDFMSAPSGGQVTKAGTWSDSAADASGTAGHFRLKDSSGTCHIQGTISASGGGGDMIVDSTAFTLGQTFTVVAFTLTSGNA